VAPLLSIAYQRRYWATYRTLRREVQSGRWGRVQSVTTHSSERWQQTIAGTWRDDPAMNPGGFIGDAGSHKIDMVFFVTNLALAEVFAHADNRGSRVPIGTTVSGRLTNGVALSMNFIGDAQHWREDFCVHCDHADLSIHDGRLWLARDNRIEPVTDLEPESNPNAAFLDCLLDGAPNQAPPECALPVWDFTQAVLSSARTGHVVGLG
jgi:predicted dehydrogenase